MRTTSPTHGQKTDSDEPAVKWVAKTVEETMWTSKVVSVSRPPAVGRFRDAEAPLSDYESHMALA